MLELATNSPMRVTSSGETSVRDEAGSAVFPSHTRIVTRVISATDSLDYRIHITP